MNWYQNNNNCYLPVYANYNFLDAQTYCLSKHANLATFADQNELDFIKNLAFRMLQGSSSVNIWVKNDMIKNFFINLKLTFI